MGPVAWSQAATSSVDSLTNGSPHSPSPGSAGHRGTRPCDQLFRAFRATGCVVTRRATLASARCACPASCSPESVVAVAEAGQGVEHPPGAREGIDTGEALAGHHQDLRLLPPGVRRFDSRVAIMRALQYLWTAVAQRVCPLGCLSHFRCRRRYCLGRFGRYSG